MAQDFLIITSIAAAAALASPLGGLIALWAKPTTLFAQAFNQFLRAGAAGEYGHLVSAGADAFMSVAVGFASGVLVGTVTFKMLPSALELSSLLLASGGSL